ncbi:zinc finger protein 584 [Rhinolophus ferrumequinum]|uniref:zinc finger protein 584 n=1 Tax=Rhinolophus ferrumequinum TaxID=59479 RepID=UPI00140FCC4D|nr:zinc finger protein 584 [Rhinolophus ferrumequinum]
MHMRMICTFEITCDCPTGGRRRALGAQHNGHDSGQQSRSQERSQFGQYGGGPDAHPALLLSLCPHPCGGVPCPVIWRTLLCWATLSSQTFPRYLLQGIHAVQKPLKCGICGKAFLKALMLLSHLLTDSTGIPFGCPAGGNTPTENATLVHHRKVHIGDVPHVCKACVKAFSHPSKLRTHQEVHTGIKPFKRAVWEGLHLQRCTCPAPESPHWRVAIPLRPVWEILQGAVHPHLEGPHWERPYMYRNVGSSLNTTTAAGCTPTASVGRHT